MATRNIAVDANVYDRLAANKRSGESFSKAIDRLLLDAAGVSTGADILKRLESLTSLGEDEANVFLDVIDADRAHAGWDTA